MLSPNLLELLRDWWRAAPNGMVTLGGFASFDLAIIRAGMVVLSEGYIAMRPVFDCRWKFAVVNSWLEPVGVSGRAPDRQAVGFNLATGESRFERVPADRGRYAAFWLRVVASGQTGSRTRTRPSAGAQIGSSVLYAVAGNSPANSHFAPESEHSHEVAGGKTPEWAAGSAPS
jgi:hypothetical protein